MRLDQRGAVILAVAHDALVADLRGARASAGGRRTGTAAQGRRAGRTFFVSGQEQQMRFPDLPTRGPAPMTGSAGALASVDAPDDDIPVRPTFFRDKKNDTNFKTLISTFAKVKEFTNW